jgi:hypothetical protein
MDAAKPVIFPQGGGALPQILAAGADGRVESWLIRDDFA